jgi:hypothetical protein
VAECEAVQLLREILKRGSSIPDIKRRGHLYDCVHTTVLDIANDRHTPGVECPEPTCEGRGRACSRICQRARAIIDQSDASVTVPTLTAADGTVYVQPPLPAEE